MHKYQPPYLQETHWHRIPSVLPYGPYVLRSIHAEQDVDLILILMFTILLCIINCVINYFDKNIIYYFYAYALVNQENNKNGVLQSLRWVFLLADIAVRGVTPNWLLTKRDLMETAIPNKRSRGNMCRSTSPFGGRFLPSSEIRISRALSSTAPTSRPESSGRGVEAKG